VVRIALTGGIATGKSHVRRTFAAHGIPTIDADSLARDVVAPGTPGADAIVKRFGNAVRGDGGGVDRQALATIVFRDPGARRDLEAIIHPAVYRAINRWLEEQPSDSAAALADIPLLYETGREGDFDVVIVAACPPDEQIRRVMSRDHLSEADARARLAAQLPIEEKVRRADHVIWTTGAPAETEAQVQALATKWTS
jgi:dephospho-CoA kinase